MKSHLPVGFMMYFSWRFYFHFLSWLRSNIYYLNKFSLLKVLFQLSGFEWCTFIKSHLRAGFLTCNWFLILALQIKLVELISIICIMKVLARLDLSLITLCKRYFSFWDQPSSHVNYNNLKLLHLIPFIYTVYSSAICLVCHSFHVHSHLT